MKTILILCFLVISQKAYSKVKVGFLLSTLQEERYQKDRKYFEEEVKRLDAEVVFYSSIYDLSEKIQKFSKDDRQRIKIAKNGKQKYMRYFNSTIVADYIIKNTFDINYKKNTFLWESK